MPENFPSSVECGGNVSTGWSLSVSRKALRPQHVTKESACSALVNSPIGIAGDTRVDRGARNDIAPEPGNFAVKEKAVNLTLSLKLYSGNAAKMLLMSPIPFSTPFRSS